MNSSRVTPTDIPRQHREVQACETARAISEEKNLGQLVMEIVEAAAAAGG